jgi:hypothetical protein
VSLMLMMLAMSVAPAFAGWESNGCRTGHALVASSFSPGVDGKRTPDGEICQIRREGGVFVRFVYYDNRDLD